MKLSFKDIQFIVEAIDNLVDTYEKNLDREDLDENRAADLGNDCMFLTSLRHSLVPRLDDEIILDEKGIDPSLDEDWELTNRVT